MSLRSVARHFQDFAFFGQEMPENALGPASLLKEWEKMSEFCVCEMCKVMDCDIGHAMLKWMSMFYQNANDALQHGADKDVEFTLTVSGPSARTFVQPYTAYGSGTMTYCEVTTSIDKIAKAVSPFLRQKPDAKQLRELYADDPLVLSLIEWIERT